VKRLNLADGHILDPAKVVLGTEVVDSCPMYTVILNIKLLHADIHAHKYFSSQTFLIGDAMPCAGLDLAYQLMPPIATLFFNHEVSLPAPHVPQTALNFILITRHELAPPAVRCV